MQSENSAKEFAASQSCFSYSLVIRHAKFFDLKILLILSAAIRLQSANAPQTIHPRHFPVGLH
jgi:hypothetical protein